MAPKRRRSEWVLVCCLLQCAAARADVRRPTPILDLTAPSTVIELASPASSGSIAIFGNGSSSGVAQPLGLVIARAALSTGVPEAFLLRLLRQESGLNPLAVSPKGALGIAQFMPATAAERGLDDPFDPEKAIPKAAELLLDLKRRYGNWGLAAAAYNAGPGRVDAWLLGRSELPQETLSYVAQITNVDATVWAAGQRQPSIRSLLYTSLASTEFGEAGLLANLTIERPLKAAGATAAVNAARSTATSLDLPTRHKSGGSRRSGREQSKHPDPLSPCAALLDQSASCIAFNRY